MDPTAPQFLPPPPVYGCYRHPDRATAIGCQRCGRPICGECMRPAPVGFQCPDCVAAGQAQAQPQAQPQVARARRTRAFGGAPATVTLIAINAVIWLAVNLTGSDNSRLLDVLALQSTGSCAVGGQDYADAAAAACAAAGGVSYPGVAEGAWWQLLTSAFTHVNPLHIGFNMLALWFLGPQLERFLGRARYLTLYLLSALAGSVAVYWLAPVGTSTLGASGAVFGLMGALLIVAWRNGGDVRNILMWLGINVAFTFFGGAGISWQGHLGGLVGGSLIALVLSPKRGSATPAARLWLSLLFVALVALTAVRTLALA